MTEEDLQEIEEQHPVVTITEGRKRPYKACGGCPMTPMGHVPYPCQTIQLVEEVRKLNGWVEFMEERLVRYDERWDREALP